MKSWYLIKISIYKSLGFSKLISLATILGGNVKSAGFVGTLISASIPAIGWVLGIALTSCIMNQAWSIASALVTERVHGNGIDIGIGWWFATPYLSFNPR